MSLLYQQFKEQVERGRQGLNKGYLTSVPAFNKFTNGVQKGTIYLIGGETGSGKTALVDQLFVLDPYKYAIKNGKRIKIFYYSFEIDKIRKLGKWMAVQLFNEKGIITSMSDIFSKNEILNDNIYNYLPEYEEYFSKLFESIIVFDQSMNPTGIYHEIKNYCESVGTWKEEKRIIKGREYTTKVYVPNDPEELIIIVTDHVGLIKRESEKGGAKMLNKKETIDLLSQYQIWLRNNYGVSSVNISQFNRDLADIDRQRFKELRPLLNDFKDTGNPSEDANFVGAIFNPGRYNITSYLDGRYNIAKLQGRFRSFHILKNRDGDDGVIIGLNFLGEAGIFRQFPQREKLTEEDIIKAIKYEKFT